MVAMEAQYGSLSRGMLAAHKQMRDQQRVRAAAQHCTDEPSTDVSGRTDVKRQPRGAFTTLRGGLQQLVDGLEAKLEPRWVHRSTPVERL
jgi:protoporphyrinogen oxidase